jgi:hypothetical protein
MSELQLARRDTVARLCRAQANGLISVEAFEERYALVREAGSIAGLDALVADLHDEPGYTVAEVDEPAPYTQSALVAAPESIRLSAVFGSSTRAGIWTVPEHIEVLVIAGEVTLDFRDATFATDTVLIETSVTMGGLKLIVPPGTQVENEATNFMSSTSHPRRGRRGAPPNGLLVIIQGRIRLGEISIKERVPTGEEEKVLKPMIDRLLGRPTK